MLSVNANGSIKTLKDFIDQGRREAADLFLVRRRQLRQLVAEDFARMAGIKIEHVPYKGASQGLTDLAGGHIVFSAQTVSSTARAGARRPLRAIAHSAHEPPAGLPGRADLQGIGYDVVATTWFSISGPANLPKDITDKVNQEITRAVSNPEAQARLQRDGLIAQSCRWRNYRNSSTPRPCAGGRCSTSLDLIGK